MKKHLHSGGNTMRTLLPALQDQTISTFLNNTDAITNVKTLHEGTIHLVFPSVITQNYSEILDSFSDITIEKEIYFAHKSTNSSAVVRHMKKLGLKCDVASYYELCSALSEGFTGHTIECTGPKNEKYLRLAIQHNCLISCDSYQELVELISLHKLCDIQQTIHVLLRVQNISAEGINYKHRTSRYGLCENEISQAFNVLSENECITLEGFHVHNDERNPEVKSAFVKRIITLMMQAYEYNLAPSIINIGGGLRAQSILSKDYWTNYVNDLEEAVKLGNSTHTYKNFAYGMHLNEKGTVHGRSQLLGRFGLPSIKETIQTILHTEMDDGRRLHEIIAENGWKLMIEPGEALLTNAGITLTNVISTNKNKDHDNITVLDTNIYNIGCQMTEHFLDPVLVKDSKNRMDSSSEKSETNESNMQKETEWHGFLVGNLCREEDILMKRKVTFNTKPQKNDIIIFFNTAGYSSHFEDARPHMHPLSKRFIITENNNFEIHTDETYNPWNNELEDTTDIANDRPNDKNKKTNAEYYD